MTDSTKFHNPEVERAFLGGVLLDNRKLPICLDEHLPPLDQTRPFDAKPTDSREPLFAEPANETIWHAILALWRVGDGFDLVTLGDYLHTHGKYEAVGGGPYLAWLEEEIVSTLHLPVYATLLCEKWRARSIRRIANSVNSEVAKADSDSGDAALTGMTSLALLADGKDRAKPSGMDELLTSALGEIESRKAAAASNGGIVGIKTGFHWLDQKTTGFRGGQLIIVAARPSVGKTSLALQLAHGIAKWTGPVAVYSLEMSKSELMERLLGVVAGVNINRIRNGTISGADHDSVVFAGLDMQNYTITVDDRTDAPIEIIKARAEQEHAKHKLRAIIVDYLQLIPAPASDGQNRAQQVADITRGLKLMAKDFNCPVIALSQLSRDGVKEKSKPELHHLRESGAIEQDADTVIFLHRPDLALDAAEIRIAKQRQGPVTGWQPCQFTRSSAKWEQIA